MAETFCDQSVPEIAGWHQSHAVLTILAQLSPIFVYVYYRIMDPKHFSFFSPGRHAYLKQAAVVLTSCLSFFFVKVEFVLGGSCSQYEELIGAPLFCTFRIAHILWQSNRPALRQYVSEDRHDQGRFSGV